MERLAYLIMSATYRLAIAVSLLLACLLYLPTARTQTALPKDKYLTFSVFNAGTLLPGNGTLGIFTTPVHPGLSVGMEFRYNRDTLKQWFQTATVGVLYHRYVQTAIQLYSETGFRRFIWSGLSAELRLGGGYLHAIPAVDVFEQRANGTYRRQQTLGRAQAMVGGTFGLGYTLRHAAVPLRFTLDYHFYLQLPFVRQYVPLLPVTTLHVGVAAPLSIFQ
ncbi:MAG: hypothetical protein C7N36_20880 [Bacteroidetes bacterium]|nr:MAG: hypothetical protein C7N36_20880 [Bacteroidota bacterium]